MVKILVIEDDQKMRNGLVEILSHEGYHVDSAENGVSGLDKIKKHDFDIVLTDLVMPTVGGMEILRETRRLKSKTQVVLITAFATVENAVEAMKTGASDYITKPFKIDEIQTKIRVLLEKAKFERNDLEGLSEASFKALSNPIRKNVILLLNRKDKLRFVEIQQILRIDDPTKLSFHLRKLKEQGLLLQDEEKKYLLSLRGKKLLEGLKKINNA